MSKRHLIGVVGLVAALAGCPCPEDVDARAFIGHLTEAECLRKININEPPTTILCPGTEVTFCWLSSEQTNEVTIVPDPDGLSGTKGQQGAITFKPMDNTVIDVRASDCASATKQVQVINGPTPATFDGHWDNTCSLVSYELNPAFVDPTVLTRDATAMWEPVGFDRFSKSFQTCPTPPFLNGWHPEDLHGFDLTAPFVTHTFSHLLHGPQNWEYQLKTCTGLEVQCSSYESKEFAMTLICPGQ